MAVKAEKEAKNEATDVFCVGRVCIKLAGRDSDVRCVVVDKVDDKFVLIDGETRRRKVNTAHLEPLDQIFKIAKNASREEVKKLFKKEFGVELKDTKAKKSADRPKKQKAKKSKTVAPKAVKKEVKIEKAEPKVEKKVEAPKVEEKPEVKDVK